MEHTSYELTAARISAAGVQRALAEAAVLVLVAVAGAAARWWIHAPPRPPLVGTAADLLDWRARTADIETVRLPGALEEALRGEQVWVDVRPLAEQRQGRIPWAIPLPHAVPADAAPPLPAVEPDRPLVLYCGSPACDSALREALRLRAAGFRRVAIFVEGYAGWAAAGGPIERTGEQER
ncbi:MAG: rhodanese-like domain-containing protein [Kiritimatiellae bacterium]|nr:rhodanese-like domain-containing protein [Kiritimatiellia bacterium]